MGKGDRRTRKGKIVRGTYGNIRNRKDKKRKRNLGRRRMEGPPPQDATPTPTEEGQE